MKDLNRSMATGAAWLIFVRLATRLLGVVSVLILSRLLTPADYGLVALATAIIAALELMTAFSFDVALIQRQDQSRAHYDTAWTITILFSAAIAIALAGFYGEPRLEAVMYVLAAGTIAEGFQNIGVVAFRKEMVFRKEFVFQVSKKVIAFAITVPLAFWLRNYWALVAGIVAGKIGGTVLSYAAHPYRPRLSTAAWAELFHFSRWLFVNNLLGFLRYRASDFVVGKLAGPAALGAFNVSFELSQTPTSELVAPINRAVFPAYAQISGDRGRLQQSYLDVVGMIAIFAIPAAAGIAVMADDLVAVLLGAKWVDAVPLIRVLGIAGMISALETNIGAAYLALGRPDIITKLYGFYVLLLVTLLISFTYQWGVTGAAWGCLTAAVLNIPIYFGAMLRTLSIALGRFLGVVWRPIIGSVLMYLTVYFVKNVAGNFGLQTSSMASLIAGTLTGVVAYIVVTTALWYASAMPGGAETVLFDRARSLLRRRRVELAPRSSQP